MNNYQIKRTITRRDSSIVNTYLKEISKYSVLTDEEQVDLFQKLEADPTNLTLKHKIFLGNLRFVISIAKQYLDNGIEFEDLISTGNIGLWKAIGQYQTNIGVKFTSYAAYWIRKEILYDLESANLHVRIPSVKITQLEKVRKYINSQYVSTGEIPSATQVAEALDLPEELINILSILSEYKNSLNTTTNSEGEEINVLDEVSDEEPNYDYITLKDSLKKYLSDKEYKIITTFFHLEEGTLDDLSSELNLTKRRLIQIKDSALEKLSTIPEIQEYKNLI